MKQIVYEGTELKLNINISPIDNHSMSDYDFKVEVYCSPSFSITVLKEDAIKVDDNNYIILVDTMALGTGKVKLKVTAYIPDDDFSDYLRTEVAYVNTDIVISKGI